MPKHPNKTKTPKTLKKSSGKLKKTSACSSTDTAPQRPGVGHNQPPKDKKPTPAKKKVSIELAAKRRVAAETSPGPGVGHNRPPAAEKTLPESSGPKSTPKTEKGGPAGAAVRKYVKAIENIEEEAREIAADKTELFRGAKEEGLDVKVLRKLIAQRKMDRIELEAMQETLDLYEFAMDLG